jgi:two-component system phosphate regulon sensor histidine kinase PhoR
MPQVWFTLFARLGLLAAAGLGIGWLYGQPVYGLLCAVSIALGWQLLWLFRLERWLNGEKMDFLPEGEGIWPRLFARIDFLRGRTKRRGKRYKALVKQMRQATRAFPDGGILVSRNHEIYFMNHAAEELLGLKRKKDRGARIENLIRDPDFVAYMRAGTTSKAVQIPSPLNHGRWLSCHLVPYGMDQQLLLVRDVTALVQADKMRRDFVANASHELRTPLTVITGYLDALADDDSLADDLQVPLQEMQLQAARMRTLVNELLRLSELESKGPAKQGKAVNIAALMAAAAQEAKAMQNCPHDIRVNIESDADLSGEVADIQSILTNLVSNAVRYTPQDGQISISWSTDDDGGYLVIADTGLGIRKDHLPRLTERFYRVEDGRERIGGAGGTGLGLAIVKHALQRHGATLAIESTPGKGSSFTCTFPVDRIIAVA